MIIDGREISSRYEQRIKDVINKHTNLGYRKPRLVIFLLSEDLASQKYVSLKEKKGQELGIDVVIYKNIDMDNVLQVLDTIKHDSNIDGIMVQLPVGEKYNRDSILKEIPESKDVDGLSPNTLGAIFHGKEEYFLSATAKGITIMLNENNINIEGKNVVIINSSIEIGLPLSAYFISKHATVQICNSKTQNLANKTREADILITATGVAHLIKEDMVKQDSIVIDCGYSFKDNKLYGDVDFDNVSKKTSLITPVPGGVGPMTITSLFLNLIDSYLRNILDGK